MESIESFIAEDLGLKLGEGVLVTSIDKKGDAFKAGVKLGDVIVKFNGNPIPRRDLFYKAMIESRSSVELEILRNGKHIPIMVPITEQTPAVESAKDLTSFDIKIKAVPQKKITPFGYAGAVQINTPNLAAQSVGLRDGDWILTINNQTVGSVEEVGNIIDNRKTPRIVLLILRNNFASFVVFDLHNSSINN